MGEHETLSISWQLAPKPLPPTWERTIADNIATTLRHGWRKHTAKSTMHPTGAPRGHAYSSAPPPEPPKDLPTTYLIREEIYAWGVIEPQHDTPWLAWHLKQLDLAHALLTSGHYRHHPHVQDWLRRKPGPPPTLYVERPNRHGNVKLRPNADPSVIDTFHVAARTATVLILDPLDVADAMAVRGISPTELGRVLSSPGNAVVHAVLAQGERK